MDIQLRDSTRADMDTIQSIYAWHVLNGLASFEEIAPSVEDLIARREAVLAHGFPYVVAVIGGDVIGYAYASLYRTRSAYRYTVEDSVYVRAGTPRRGIGRALLTEVIARSERIGMRQMIAVIGDSGNTASIGLHAALGFITTGVLRSVGFKHGRWVDSVIMQRALGPGDSSTP
jgi:phosphinothricin acetyltransferase